MFTRVEPMEDTKFDLFPRNYLNCVFIENTDEVIKKNGDIYTSYWK